MLEIGPGPGGLTRALLDAGVERLVAIERDPRCIAALQPLVEAAAGRLELIQGDALDLDIARFGERLVIVANLPYNIATALLLTWLDRLEWVERMTLMFQREVAERLVAAPRTPAYGRLSVPVQWLCEVRILMHVPPGAFVPPPAVTSSLVGITPRPAPLAPADKATLEKVLAAAFGQRRKMLRSSLKRLIKDPQPLLAAAGLPPTARAEEIDIEGFCRLAECYRALSAKPQH